MATLTTQEIDRDGLDPSFAAAAAGGDECETGRDVFLVVKNGDTSSHDVTLAAQKSVAGLDVADRVVSVPDGEERWIRVTDVFADPDNGDRCQISYDAVTSVTVGVFKV